MREHGLAAQAAQLRLHELGDVKEYPSLGALARGGSSAARLLLQLQQRLAGEDPTSVQGRRDVFRIRDIEEALGRAGLQPTMAERENPLNSALEGGNTLRVKVVNME